jgi:tRNA wybutosine-synthesizing protein 4
MCLHALQTYPSISEKGEVISTHYKLFSADICDIPKLDSVIRMAEMDPR